MTSPCIVSDIWWKTRSYKSSNGEALLHVMPKTCRHFSLLYRSDASPFGFLMTTLPRITQHGTH